MLPGQFYTGSIEVVCGPMFSGKTEELIRKDLIRQDNRTSPPRKNDPDKERLETELSQRLGQPVKITSLVSGKGKLEIAFSSLDELDGLLARLGYPE